MVARTLTDLLSDCCALNRVIGADREVLNIGGIAGIQSRLIDTFVLRLLHDRGKCRLVNRLRHDRVVAVRNRLGDLVDVELVVHGEVWWTSGCGLDVELLRLCEEAFVGFTERRIRG